MPMFLRSVRAVTAVPLKSHHRLAISVSPTTRFRRCFSTIFLDRDTKSISVPGLCASFPFAWLRDTCQCPRCVHPSTRQKLHRSSDFAISTTTVSPVKAEAVENGLRVSWSTDPLSENVDHESFYPASFLAHHASPTALFAFHRDVFAEPWTAAQFSSRPDFSYASLKKEPETLLEVYKQLRRDGLVFFTGIPTEETSNEKCELRQLAERLSTIRRTFYGETWDVMNIRNSKNIAYTNLDLGLHMDLMYFKEPPRYQMLHALRNRVRGGQSLFVDALHAAQRLQSSSPEAFEILANTPVPFHYINDGHHLHYSHPTIEVSPYKSNLSPDSLGHPSTTSTVEITSINYSPPFQAPLPVSTPPSFYTALARFVDLLEEPEACVTRLLREGDAVIFDNRRILHARAGFEEVEGEGKEGEGETSRWLKGCYLEEDPALDRMRVLREQLD